MGRGGIGLSSGASAWSGAAVTSKKDRHLIAASSLPTIALSLNAPWFARPRGYPKPWQSLGARQRRTAIVGKLVKTRGKRLPVAHSSSANALWVVWGVLATDSGSIDSRARRGVGEAHRGFLLDIQTRRRAPAIS